MDDLVQFLRDRLDEDERIARRACEYAEAEWHLDEEFGETVLWWPPEPRIAEKEREKGLPVVSDKWRGQTIESGGTRIAPHIARHDPACVLRGVKAKRAVVDEYAYWAERAVKGVNPMPDEAGRFEVAATMAKALAGEWDTHPDFRPEWRP